MRPLPSPPASCISSPLSRQHKTGPRLTQVFPLYPFQYSLSFLPFLPNFSKSCLTLMFPLPPSHLLQNQLLFVPKFNHDLHVSKLNGQLPILPDTVGLTFLPWLPGHKLLWFPSSLLVSCSLLLPPPSWLLSLSGIHAAALYPEGALSPPLSFTLSLDDIIHHSALPGPSSRPVYPMNLRSSYPGHPTGVTHPEWPNGNPSHPLNPAPPFPISSHLEMPTTSPKAPSQLPSTARAPSRERSWLGT